MSSIIRRRSGLTVLVSLMESSFLFEACNTSILRTGALHCYHYYTLNWLPAPRLLPPRSGLARSDFVHWPKAAVPECLLSRRCWGISRSRPNQIALARRSDGTGVACFLGCGPFELMAL